jgi:ribonuclease J
VNGDLVRLAPGKPGRFDSVPNGRLVLDGDIIGPADGDAVVMRRRLANSGVVIVALAGQIGTSRAGCGWKASACRWSRIMTPMSRKPSPMW